MSNLMSIECLDRPFKNKLTWPIKKKFHVIGESKPSLLKSSQIPGVPMVFEQLAAGTFLLPSPLPHPQRHFCLLMMAEASLSTLSFFHIFPQAKCLSFLRETLLSDIKMINVYHIRYNLMIITLLLTLIFFIY